MNKTDHLGNGLAKLVFGGIIIAFAFIIEKWKDRYLEDPTVRSPGADDGFTWVIFYYIALAVGFMMILFAVLHFGRAFRDMRKHKEKERD